jgi:hypothetical protein
MAKSRRRSHRRRSRKRRGGIKVPSFSQIKQKVKGNVGVAALVARYITQVLKPGTWYPKTRQLMLDSFIYASLVAGDWKTNNPGKKPIQPIYGKHTYISGQPPVTGGKDDQAMEANVNAPAATGGRRRRSRKKRRKSRRKSKKRKSRRRRKKSRRRRRR